MKQDGRMWADKKMRRRRQLAKVVDFDLGGYLTICSQVFFGGLRCDW